MHRIFFIGLLALLMVPRPARGEDEIHVVPAIAYDSDLGLGLGAMGAVARLQEGVRPYLWRIEALAYTTFKLSPETGRPQAIQHDHHIFLDAPGLDGGRSRLSLELGYGRRVNLGYYGFGPEALLDEVLLEESPRLNQYRQASPGASATYQRVIRELGSAQLRTYLRGEARFSQLGLYSGSLLEADLERSARDPVRRFLRGTKDHADLVAGAGLLLDGRDAELAPTRGYLLSAGLRGGTAIGDALLWAGLTTDLRFFSTLADFGEGRRLSFAARLAGDLLGGAPPFYELSEIGGPKPYSATGGAIGLRGVLARRFHGMGKVLLNLELRTFLVRFRVLSARFELRALAFSDLGLVWADPLRRTIEGPPRLGAGLGGGLRLLWGKTFLVRADYGVSPTDGTTGFYLDLGHIF